MNTTTQHKVTWFVYAWNSEGRVQRLRRTAEMRGTWAYDVECSCGWTSSTGGATRNNVQNLVSNHKKWEN
jgi:hypothetical protein